MKARDADVEAVEDHAECFVLDSRPIVVVLNRFVVTIGIAFLLSSFVVVVLCCCRFFVLSFIVFSSYFT